MPTKEAWLAGPLLFWHAWHFLDVFLFAHVFTQTASSGSQPFKFMKKSGKKSGKGAAGAG
jgi:hypothetical protein